MLKKIVTFIMGIFLLAGIYVGHMGYQIYKDLSEPKAINPQAQKGGIVQESQNEFNKPFNLLVIGIDQRNKETSRSDTIMIYHIDPQAHKVSLLTVPRDTYVNIPGRGLDKVNHAFAFGGIDLTKKSLQNFLGIKIDHYMITNFDGFKNLVDLVGGITINVEKHIRGTDIQPGVQKLDSKRALAYVRDRHDPMGDIARVKRQQKFIKALASELAAYEPKYKLAMEIPSMYRNVKTDLSLQETKSFFELYRNLDVDKVETEVVPGWFYNKNGISYWKPNQSKTKTVVQKIFSIEKEQPAKL